MGERGTKGAPAPLEKDIQAAVLEHWQLLGRPMTLVAAIPNAGAMGQPGLTCGLADLLVMGPDVPNKIAFMELKRGPHDDPTEAQLGFASLCAMLGLHCPCVRGRDEPITYLEKWNVVKRRAHPEPPGWDERFQQAEWP